METQKFDHDDLVMVTAWMARHGFTADELAEAVAKPWHHLDYLELAREDRSPADD